MSRDNPTVVALGFFLAVLLVAQAVGSARGPMAESDEAVEARLAALRQVVDTRVRCRNRLTSEVIAGRTDLLVAAAWFRLLDEQATAAVSKAFDPLAGLPGDTVEEKLCYSVLDRARNATFTWGISEQEEVCARLERRIAEARAQGGGRIVLPEW